MPSNPPVQKLPRERPPCASTPSPTAYVPVTSSPNEDSEEYKHLWADLEAEWPLGGGHLFQMHPFGAVLGCSRGLPKARGASISTKCQSRNSSPYSTAFPRNVPAWSAPSRAPCGN